MIKLGGYKPDLEDEEYLAFDNSFFFGFSASSSGEVDLRQYTSPRHNQRTTNSCVAQSLVKALEIKRIQKNGIKNHVDLSVMDLYFGARDLMNPKETNIDEGTRISLACEVLKRFGVCREVMNPFNENNLFIPTPILATRESYMNKIKSSFKITSQDKNRVDDVIANLRMGNPVVFGTLIDDYWLKYENHNNPIKPVAKENSKGGHAICIVGWVKDKFVIENSWGNYWGDNGFAYLEPEVISSKSSSDFWVIVEGSEAWHENVK